MYRSSLLASLLLFASSAALAQSTDAVQPLVESLTGTYYPREQPGQGLAVEIRPRADGRLDVFVAYFGFGDDGDNHWLAGNVAVAAGTLRADVPVFSLHDGDFASALESATLRRSNFGTLSLAFNACRTAFVDFNPNDHAPDSPFPRQRDMLVMVPLLLPGSDACID